MRKARRRAVTAVCDMAQGTRRLNPEGPRRSAPACHHLDSHNHIVRSPGLMGHCRDCQRSTGTVWGCRTSCCSFSAGRAAITVPMCGRTL